MKNIEIAVVSSLNSWQSFDRGGCPKPFWHMNFCSLRRGLKTTEVINEKSWNICGVKVKSDTSDEDRSISILWHSFDLDGYPRTFYTSTLAHRKILKQPKPSICGDKSNCDTPDRYR